MTCTKCPKNALSGRKVCYQCNNPSRDFGARANATHKYRKICAERLAKLMCEYCEQYVAKATDLHVDHVNGNHGDDRPENYQVLCVACHVAKTRLKGEYRKRS